jgi:hypothetical protein
MSSCPSCGANLKLKSRFTKVVICEYCNQTSIITELNKFSSVNVVNAKLLDTFSILYLGAKFNYLDMQCEVIGRVQYEYNQGNWDEWFIKVSEESVSEESYAWLEEDEGSFSIHQPFKIMNVIPDINQIQVGTTFTLNHNPFFVTEKINAKIIAAEGELLLKIHPEATVWCVDGISEGGIVSIEYCLEDISVSKATEINIDDIVLGS